MELTLVDKGVRFQNFVIDWIIIMIFLIPLKFILELSDLVQVLVLQIIYFLYYFIMEYKYQQTIGKKLTGTFVVNKQGERLTVKQLLIRTLFRLSGINAFSFLFGNNVGMHDWFSNTRVIKVSKLKTVFE